MDLEHGIGRNVVSGLRTKYSPRMRINQGLIMICPWVDIVLLFMLFLLLDGKFVLQPGTVVELPRKAFTGGSRSALIAVVLAVPAMGKDPGGEVIFFDDERFIAADARQIDKLGEAMRNGAAEHPDRGLVIQADASVSHGTVVVLMNMAMDAGIDSVNVASRAP